MIFIWEEKDIVAGQMYKSSPDEMFKMIGYLSRNHFTRTHYTSISLQDGFIPKAVTKKELALKLTEINAQPLEWYQRENKL